MRKGRVGDVWEVPQTSPDVHRVRVWGSFLEKKKSFALGKTFEWRGGSFGILALSKKKTNIISSEKKIGS